MKQKVEAAQALDNAKDELKTTTPLFSKPKEPLKTTTINVNKYPPN